MISFQPSRFSWIPWSRGGMRHPQAPVFRYQGFPGMRPNRTFRDLQYPFCSKRRSRNIPGWVTIAPAENHESRKTLLAGELDGAMSEKSGRSEFLITLTSNIAAAYVSNHQVAVEEVPGLIQNIFGVLVGLGKKTEVVVAPSEPAVAIRSPAEPDSGLALNAARR